MTSSTRFPETEERKSIDGKDVLKSDRLGSEGRQFNSSG